jgi:hypothetical protein
MNNIDKQISEIFNQSLSRRLYESQSLPLGAHQNNDPFMDMAERISPLTDIPAQQIVPFGNNPYDYKVGQMIVDDAQIPVIMRREHNGDLMPTFMEDSSGAITAHGNLAAPIIKKNESGEMTIMIGESFARSLLEKSQEHNLNFDVAMKFLLYHEEAHAVNNDLRHQSVWDMAVGKFDTTQTMYPLNLEDKSSNSFWDNARWQNHLRMEHDADLYAADKLMRVDGHSPEEVKKSFDVFIDATKNMPFAQLTVMESGLQLKDYIEFEHMQRAPHISENIDMWMRFNQYSPMSPLP